MNARSMRKRKENVCNSIISNFCGDFFKKKIRFFFLYVDFRYFISVLLFFFLFVHYFISFDCIYNAYTHTHIIHPSASYIVNKMFSIGNFFMQPLACINALLRLFKHNKCISICVFNGKRRRKWNI